MIVWFQSGGASVNNVIKLINCVISQYKVSFIFELLVLNNNLIYKKMKKIILFACIMILSLSAGTVFANSDSKTGSEKNAVPDKKEVKLSGEELNRLTRRDGEIRTMDTNVAATQEGRGMRRDRDGIRGDHRRGGGVIYIGGGTVLLIILIILLV
jgi:hypothetical protein